jgi:predicted Holliday junction resolvase-like endonuclease
LNFLLEISLFGAIIYLSYKIYLLKQETSNAESLNKENQFLKNQYNQSQEYYSKQQKSIEDYRKELEYKEKFLVETNRNLEEKLAEETEKNKKILSQKKSSEVRLGHIAETLAPFLDQFDFEPEQCTFLGQPIDYISFGEEEITFIEVKSGKSQLNPKQKHIKKQVADKLVAWKEIRIK